MLSLYVPFLSGIGYGYFVALAFCFLFDVPFALSFLYTSSFSVPWSRLYSISIVSIVSQHNNHLGVWVFSSNAGKRIQ